MQSRIRTHPSKIQNLLISLGLFLLALAPRAYDLARFVTADEAKWVYRSAQFLAALLQGDFAATSVNLTPAVTTTWLGSVGLWLYYQLNLASMNQPLTDWLLSLPEFRTDLDVLVATRWSMVILTSLAVVMIYWLARRLFPPTVALIGAIFIALDPHTISLSRILGHDAPAAVFMTLSVLLLLLTVRQVESHRSRGGAEILPPHRRTSAFLLYILSGMMAGLAFLSKAPTFFLLPFAGLLFLSQIWGNSRQLYFWVKRFLMWGLAAYATFIIVWPAAWIDPLGRPLAVIENGFLSATDQEEADSEGYWLVPDLGPFYYLVNIGFKLSPLIMIGTGLAIFYVVKQQPMTEWANGEWVSDESLISNLQFPISNLPSPHLPTSNQSPISTLQSPNLSSPLLWLLVFTLGFTLFMTLGDKRSPRYILPIFPALSLAAAYGWVTLSEGISGKWQVAGESSNRFYRPRTTDHGLRTTFYTTLILAAALLLWPYIPYYFTYYNPLLGGSYTAPHIVKIGWGEGLDQAGRFLQRELPDRRVGTAYASTVAPFFTGNLSSVDGPQLDYLILYRKQVQSGEPSPSFIRYFEQLHPIFSVDLNGLRYADVYPGPALQPALALTPGLDAAILPQPTGFRPATGYGRIGELLAVDVVWLAAETLPSSPSLLTMEPLSVFDFSHDDHDHDEAVVVSEEREETAPTIFAQSEGLLTRVAEGLVISRHQLDLPADLSRGLYALRVDGRPLGEIELRNFQAPLELTQVNDLSFDGQIALSAYRFEVSEDFVGVTVAWQALKSHLPDYTIFVQILEVDNNQRLAGVDSQPLQGAWPTSRWVEDEVVVDRYLVAVSNELDPGSFKIIVGLYRPDTGKRLRLPTGQDHWVVPWTIVRE